jgi:hypothetical protein
VRELFQLEGERGRKGDIKARTRDREEIPKEEVKCLSLITNKRTKYIYINHRADFSARKC